MRTHVGIGLALAGFLLLALFLRLRSDRGALPPTLPPVSTNPPAPIAELAKENGIGTAEPIATRAEIAEPAPIAEPPEEDLSAKRVATVLGRVIDHETERPLADARIACVPRWKDPDRPDVLAVSGPDGRFRFETPCDGARSLRVEADGYPIYWAWLFNLPFPGMRDRGRIPLCLDAIRLRHGAQPLVRVVDGSGGRCAGAELYLFTGSELGTSDLTRFLGVTDEHGEWAASGDLAEHAEGVHVLATTSSGWGWTPLSLVPQGSKGHLLEVRLRPSGELAFHVEDELGAPLAGVEVIVHPKSYPIGTVRYRRVAIGAALSEPFRARLTASTDEHGDARIANLPSDDGAIAWGASLDSPGWTGTVLKDLRAIGHEPRRVVLKRETFVHGFVGSVLDRAGHAVPSAIVRCGEIRCRPDATTGGFHIDVPETPSDRLPEVSAPGYEITGLERHKPATDPLVLDFVLDPANTIAGTVTDANGRPIEGIALRLKMGPSGSSRPAISAVDGTFRFPAVTGRALTLYADRLDTGAEAWQRGQMEVAPGDQAVHLVLEADLNPPRGTLHAHVVDAQSLAPVPVLAADIYPEASQAMLVGAASNARMVRQVGELRVRGLADCNWRAWVLSSEGRMTTFDFEIAPGRRDLEIEVPIGPLRAIVGRVRLEGKLLRPPADGESVKVCAAMRDVSSKPSGGFWHDAHLATRQEVHLAEDGSFRIERLVPGNYHVFVDRTDFGGAVNIVLGVKEDAEIVLDLKRVLPPAFLTLNRLDRVSDGFLFVRLDYGSARALEIDVDPSQGESQTFNVDSGHVQLTVFASKGRNLPAPPLGTKPIHAETLDLAPNEKRTVELFPR